MSPLKNQGGHSTFGFPRYHFSTTSNSPLYNILNLISKIIYSLLLTIKTLISQFGSKDFSGLVKNFTCISHEKNFQSPILQVFPMLKIVQYYEYIMLEQISSRSLW
jgi:hypothetical protein